MTMSREVFQESSYCKLGKDADELVRCKADTYKMASACLDIVSIIEKCAKQTVWENVRGPEIKFLKAVDDR